MVLRHITSDKATNTADQPGAAGNADARQENQILLALARLEKRVMAK
jgi:hypothetical protein